jgi:hypothetical protein
MKTLGLLNRSGATILAWHSEPFSHPPSVRVDDCSNVLLLSATYTTRYTAIYRADKNTTQA